MVVYTGDPGEWLNIELCGHTLHSLAYHFSETGLSLLFIVAKLVEFLFWNHDGEMNQLLLCGMTIIRIENPVSFAICEIFPVITEKRTSAWTFTVQILFSFSNVSRYPT